VEVKVINERMVERTLKYLLWQRGAWKISYKGPEELGAFLSHEYSNAASRKFDAEFMGDQVYHHHLNLCK